MAALKPDIFLKSVQCKLFSLKSQAWCHNVAKWFVIK